MSRGYFVPCAPYLYLVPDGGGMDCLPLQQRRPPGPFQYLLDEQAKSLVALQELQNEVGALLEFRDLVMETFPHLRSKSGSASRREWEPGVRVRRKLPASAASSAAASKDSSRKQPKSGGESSSAGSTVQDSGFGTETSSSGKPAQLLDETEDELWNLLDVIHRKGTKLREEVEVLSARLGDGSSLVTPPRQRSLSHPQLPVRRLGALDGVVSSPQSLPCTAPDPEVVAAILRESDPVELQRHLLTTAAYNKTLQKRLEKASKSHISLIEQLDKVKDENEDLRFQLEEKRIELEGTRARVRVLERQHQLQKPTLLPPDASTNPILPFLALPMPEDHIHHSSSTESAHDQAEIGKKQASSPKKRPSKIPLPGLKSYYAPKPPSGKTIPGKNKIDSSSLVKTGKESSWRSKSDSFSSPSGAKNSLSVRHNSKDSLISYKNKEGTPSKGKADSMSGKKSSNESLTSAKTRDIPSQNSYSSNTSSYVKRDSITNKSKDTSSSGRKSLHHQTSRRVSNSSITRGNTMDQVDQNTKVRPTKLSFWSNWLKILDNGPS